MKKIKCTRCGGTLYGPIRAVEGGFTCKYIRCLNCGEHYWEARKDPNYLAFTPEKITSIIKKLSEYSW